MKTAIVCCLHGNEKYGLKIMKKLSSRFPFFVGNPLAIKKNKRFIDSDLNRSFPGKKNGNYEERQAFQLLKKLKAFDYVIDLHSSSNKCPLFGIITKPNKEKIKFAGILGIKRLVIMPKHFASGKSLIDFVKCGISIEIGPHKRKKNILEISRLIDNPEKNNLEIFKVIKIIKKENKKILIKNFEIVKKDQMISIGKNIQKAKFNFIPILVNEISYKDILCLACKKVKISQVLKTKSA